MTKAVRLLRPAATAGWVAPGLASRVGGIVGPTRGDGGPAGRVGGPAGGVGPGLGTKNRFREITGTKLRIKLRNFSCQVSLTG
jgi:hypothetical protein